jgi:Tfp pilus assembly protein PilX
MNCCHNEDGTVLIIAVLTIVALFALGTALAFLTRTDVNIARLQTLHTEAIYVAEAGVEEALHRMSMTDPTNVTVNGSTINAAIGDVPGPAGAGTGAACGRGSHGHDPGCGFMA